jgi:hypothetical protein
MRCVSPAVCYHATFSLVPKLQLGNVSDAELRRQLCSQDGPWEQGQRGEFTGNKKRRRGACSALPKQFSVI